MTYQELKTWLITHYTNTITSEDVNTAFQRAGYKNVAKLVWSVACIENVVYAKRRSPLRLSVCYGSHIINSQVQSKNTVWLQPERSSSKIIGWKRTYKCPSLDYYDSSLHYEKDK